MFNSKTYENVVALGTQYKEAVLASAKAYKVGAEQLSKTYFDLTNASVARSIDAGKKIAALKTPEEVLKAQADFAVKSVDLAYADGKALVDLSVKVANEVSQPIVDHFNASWTAATKAA